MPPGPLEIKEKNYLTYAPPSDMPTYTVKLYHSRLLQCQYNTYMPCKELPAGLVFLLPQTPLLFKHAYWSSAAARWMVAGLWPLNQHACRSCVTQYCMSAGGVLLYLPIPDGMLSHYQSCLLVWCFVTGHCLLVWYLTISHACWFGASL